MSYFARHFLKHVQIFDASLRIFKDIKNDKRRGQALAGIANRHHQIS
jgi:hypothetical protein